MHYDYKTRGTCALMIHFDIDDEKRLRNLSFDGGCNGNLKAIGKLCEGMDASAVRDILNGNICGIKDTSCADQLSRAIAEAL